MRTLKRGAKNLASKNIKLENLLYLLIHIQTKVVLAEFCGRLIELCVFNRQQVHEKTNNYIK